MSDKEFLKYEDEQVEVDVDGVIYIEDTTYRVFTDGTREVACSAKYPKPSDEPTPEPEPTEIEVLQDEVTALQLALVEQYEENLALQEEVTNTQMALCELYEGVYA